MATMGADSHPPCSLLTMHLPTTQDPDQRSATMDMLAPLAGIARAAGELIMAIYAIALVPYGAGLVVAMPLMVISNYTGYKALFLENEPALAASPSPPPA